MAVINTNISALAAQGSLSNVQKKQQTAMERLSTGMRINTAADDAAGLAITNRMTSQIRGYAVAIRNANDGLSMTQTAEGALGNIGDMLQRMRELAVQASNGSNSAENRQAIQAEVSQLKDQINLIAKQTNFNDIKLLDGSAGNVVLQTGVNQNETMAMKFDSAQSKDLGLKTPPALTSVGGVVTGAALAEGDLIINGITVGPTVTTQDKLSSSDQEKSAIAKAAAINLVSDKTNVVASVNVNTVYGYSTTMETSAVSSTGTISINGVSTSSFSLGASASTSVARVATVNAINQISSQTGVTAIDNGDDTHGVSLVAADGRNVVIGTFGGSLTAALTGLAATGTYVGTYSLSSTNGQPITIASKVGGTLSNSGLVAGTYDSNIATAVTRARAGSTSAFTALTGADLQINGVTVGAAVQTDDLATFGTTAGTKVSSAIATAAAINKISSLTGVTAKANANVLVGSTFTAAAQDASAATGSVVLNGVTISVAFSANMTRENWADTINLYQGQTGVVAADNGVGITYSAADGRTISISASNGGSAVAAAALGLGSLKVNGITDTYTATSAAATGKMAFVSTVSLTSNNPFTLNSASSGNANIASLGFSSGTFGGSPNSMSVDKLDVTTASGSMAAIATIDGAIKQVSAQQAKAGAYQNRLESVVSILTESNQNMSASRSRILDTDYASETTNLAKSQIISQAATAMLAQANQSGQSVLALLK